MQEVLWVQFCYCSCSFTFGGERAKPVNPQPVLLYRALSAATLQVHPHSISPRLLQNSMVDIAQCDERKPRPHQSVLEGTPLKLLLSPTAPPPPPLRPDGGCRPLRYKRIQNAAKKVAQHIFKNRGISASARTTAVLYRRACLDVYIIYTICFKS